MYFSMEEIRRSQEYMSHLNSLVGQEMSGHEDINNAISFRINKYVEVEYEDVLTVLDEGPIYIMKGKIDDLPLTIFVGDFNCVHSIVGISVGFPATYLNENIRNIIKKDVN